MPTTARSFSIGPYKDTHQKELLKILDSHQGPKAIYWQREVIAPINLIVGNSILKEHGVEHSYVIDPQQMSQSPPDVKTIFFVIHSDLRILDCLQNIFKIEYSTQRSSGGEIATKKQHCLLAIPSLSAASKSFLRDANIYDKLAGVYELPLTLLPLDTDLLSLEDPNCFADFSLHEKENSLFHLARGLMRFQTVFGLFPRIHCKGPKAKRVASMMVQMRQEAAASANLDPNAAGAGSSSPPSFGSSGGALEAPGQTDLLIIIDRCLDIVTPCLSQLTYEGLINEVWPVKYGSIKMPVSDDSGTSKRVVFNSADQLFSEIRDLNFASVGSILSKRTKELSNIMQQTKSSNELTKLRQVVGQLPELRQLYSSASLHMHIAESVQDYATSENFAASFRAQQDFLIGNDADKPHPYIEQRILQMAPIEEVLRLICVQSFCNGGLKQRLLDFYKCEIIQMYGPEHMMTLDNLERVGLLEEESSRMSIAPQSSGLNTTTVGSSVRHTIAAISTAYGGSLRRSLRLQVAPVSGANGASDGSPTLQSLDSIFASLFGGTVPISVRLVQAMALGWPTRSMMAPNSAASGSGGASLANAAISAIQAGRRLVSGATVVSVSSGGYVTSLLPAVEVDEIQTPGEGFKSQVGTGGGGHTVGAARPGSTANSSSTVSKTVVVAFVGGVTHSELAALRQVAAFDEGRVDFVFVTTGLLTWRSFIQSLSEPIPVVETEG